MKHAELIARLEAAEVGSRELDAAVDEATGSPVVYIVWEGGGSSHTGLPITTSLDCSLALAERLGWRPHSADFSIAGRCSWSVISALPNVPFSDEDGRAYDGYGYKVASAKTPALAMCAAILRALDAQEQK